jgi:hypothetical protein
VVMQSIFLQDPRYFYKRYRQHPFASALRHRNRIRPQG